MCRRSQLASFTIQTQDQTGSHLMSLSQDVGMAPKPRPAVLSEFGTAISTSTDAADAHADLLLDSSQEAEIDVEVI